MSDDIIKRLEEHSELLRTQVATEVLTELFDYYEKYEKDLQATHTEPNSYVLGLLALTKGIKKKICEKAKWHSIPLNRKTD